MQTIPTAPAPRPRKQSEARRVLKAAAPFQCCAVCGLAIPTCLTVAHLDNQSANNAPDNLAWLCWTHHWMYDCGFYPRDAILALQAHWQKTKGVPDHKPRMKDAGIKARDKRRANKAAAPQIETAPPLLAGLAG